LGKKPEKQEERPEIVSLNEELFSLESGNLTVEELDRRLELAVAAVGKFICDIFSCADFTSCDAFGCGTFRMPRPR
jgi:hypothetical protein